ncbi:TlpA family protein disulfide reductase [Alteribacillus sp. JSM 102045]|uniref:TlpA family protein disulfide reductase n=1 Tax=Alteribacillus sp. JSM 102045 TaxID=1562101 RepID=UPI0035C1F7E8
MCIIESFLFYSVIILFFTQTFSIFAILLLFRQFGEVYLSTPESISRDGLSLDKEIPPFNIFSFTQNKQVNSDELIKKPTLIAFISPNCEPCKSLLKDWSFAYEEYGDNINFVLVLIGREKEVKKMIEKNMVAGEQLWDHHKELFQKFGVRVTPFVFAVDQNGFVKDKGLCSYKEQIDLLASAVLQ